MKNYNAVFSRIIPAVFVSVFLLQLGFPSLLSAQNIAKMEFAWAKKMGGAQMDESRGIAVDTAGNVYTTGWYQGPADLGNGSLIYGGNGIFVTKMDNAGNLIWAKTLVGPGAAPGRGMDIAVDDEGGVYVTGFFYAKTDFDPGPDSFFMTTPGQGTAHIFVLKLDHNGDFVWARNPGPGEGRGISVDQDRNVFIGGFYQAPVSFGTTTLSLYTNTNIDGFVAKIDAGGNFVWAKAVKGPNVASNKVLGVEADGAGNVCITGDFGNTITLGTITLTAVSSVDILIAKLNSSGDFIWAKQFGRSGWNEGIDITVDRENNIYASGYFAASTDFNPGVDSFIMVPFGSGNDTYVLKLTPDGDFVWANRIGGELSETGGWGIAVDNFANVYLASRIRNPVVTVNTTFDTLAHLGVNLYNYDILIAKLDREGNFVWSANMGTIKSAISTSETAFDIAVDAAGSLYTTGVIEKDSVDFDPGPDTFYLHSYYDSWDAFVLKLSCAPTTHEINVRVQCGDTTINEVLYSAEGTYTQTLPGYYGCDSILTIHLTIDGKLHAKPEIDVDQYVLSTVSAYATYQWIFNGTGIDGATNRSYTVMENGHYQVYASDANGCSDTSRVYKVNNVSIHDHSLASLIRIHPNPAQDFVYIQSPVSVDAVLMGLDGRILLTQENAQHIFLGHMASGIYILQLTDQEGNPVKLEKIVKH